MGLKEVVVGSGAFVAAFVTIEPRRRVPSDRAARDGTSVDEATRAMSAGVSIGRPVMAHEVADVVTFLVAPRSAGIT